MPQLANPTDNRRWWTLGALVISMLILGLDATVLNVALPTIATQLSAGTDGLQWIVNSYTLVFAGLLLPFGALGDRFGRKRLLLIGLAVFGLASLLAAWSDGLGMVIAARTLMGVGAAIVTPVGLSVLPVLFAPHERAKAIAIATMGMGIGIPLGPIVGGYLLEHYWWGSIFLINVPVVLLGMLAISLLMPESKDPRPRGADLIGGVLSTVGLISLVYGVIEAPGRGWSAPVVVGSLLAAVVLLSTFVWWELRTGDPMIDLRLFGKRAFRWGTVAATVATFGLFGLLFIAPQYLAFVLGYDAMDTGLRLLPLIGGLVVGSPIAAKLSTSFGHRIPVTAGLLIITAGLLLGSTTTVDSGYGFVALWCTVIGLGIGASLAPAMDAVLGALPADRAGSGTAITMTLRQTAGALGVALLGSVLSAAYVNQLDVTGLPPALADLARESTAGAFAVARQAQVPGLATSARSALAHGMSTVLLVCAAITLLGAALAAFGLPRRAADRFSQPGDTIDPAGHAQGPPDTGESADDLARAA